jgi:hypothetical protein
MWAPHILGSDAGNIDFLQCINKSSGIEGRMMVMKLMKMMNSC